MISYSPFHYLQQKMREEKKDGQDQNKCHKGDFYSDGSRG